MAKSKKGSKKGGSKKGKKDKKGKKGKKEPKQPQEMYHFGVDIFQMPNGDVYEGEYCAHRFGLVWREGKGIYSSHEGQVYMGNWQDDRLIENSELTILFPNEHVFKGRLIKDKYNGPGVYNVRPDLVISCEFQDNKPNGDAILIDKEDDLWFADCDPKKDSAIFELQNYFFENITECRGQGIPKVIKYPKFSAFSVGARLGERKSMVQFDTRISVSQMAGKEGVKKEVSDLEGGKKGKKDKKEKKSKKSKKDKSEKKSKKGKKGKGKKGKKGKKAKSDSEIPEGLVLEEGLPLIEEQFVEEEEETESMKARRLRREKVRKMFDPEKEEKIFHRTTKTLNDIDFTQCSWYQDYLRFEVTKEEISRKILEEGLDNLTKDEKKWCREYKRWMKIMYLRQIIRDLENRKTPDTHLLDEFFSKDFRGKSMGIPTMYPRKDWDVSFDKEKETWQKNYTPVAQTDVDVFDSSSNCSSCEVKRILGHKPKRTRSSSSVASKVSIRSAQTDAALNEEESIQDVVEVVYKARIKDLEVARKKNKK